MIEKNSLHHFSQPYNQNSAIGNFLTTGIALRKIDISEVLARPLIKKKEL
ncbi:MAG: hypothetical protein IPO27_12245 [Bacteroidetes bacterium]|nr:hypothetical protein [Bacteroidota bacterium]